MKKRPKVLAITVIGVSIEKGTTEKEIKLEKDCEYLGSVTATNILLLQWNPAMFKGYLVYPVMGVIYMQCDH